MLSAAAAAAGRATVGGLLREQARIRPDELAVEDARVRRSYGAFNGRVNRLAHALAARGVGRGDRVAMLSENRAEYVEAEFACAKLGAIAAALNWRFADDELDYALALTEPRLALASPRFAERLDLPHRPPATIVFGEAYEALLAAARDTEPPDAAEPEDGLVLLYTGGTTGRPKGALVSHRAFIARALAFAVDLGVSRADTFAAWAPMFHMASTDLSIGSLLIGGSVAQIDGFDLDRLLPLAESRRLGWLVLMPGVYERLFARLRAAPARRPRGIRFIGAMADLTPRRHIAEATRLLGAPFLNSFGATETGIPPASATLFPVGDPPERLSKRQNSLCEVRLLRADGSDAADGEPGEMAVRGPTLFSGYWRAEEANAEAFRGGWFRMGDIFRRNADGTYDFVDRANYLIKSGGENIYPAEVERVLRADRRVADAAVVRRPDEHWGEVPVAFVARADPGLTAGDLMEACRARLAGYKRPKAIRFIEPQEFPRSTSGKILRRELEGRLARERETA